MTSDDVRDHVSAQIREALTPKELQALRRTIKFYSGDEDTEVDNQNIDDACRELIRMRDAEIKAQTPTLTPLPNIPSLISCLGRLPIISRS